MIVVEVFAGAMDIYNIARVSAIGTVAVVPLIYYEARRRRVRRMLNRRVPPRRLRMNGVEYVH